MKIAFGYKMRSGKDTSVEYLIKKYGGEKISFSQPLYEAVRTKSDGWVCVKINRCHAPEYGTHISEMDLDDIPETEWDFVINNDGSIEDLYVSLDKIIVSVIPSVVANH